MQRDVVFSSVYGLNFSLDWLNQSVHQTKRMSMQLTIWGKGNRSKYLASVKKKPL
jgi:hypothetical protein